MREVVELDYEAITKALSALPPAKHAPKKEPTEAQRRALLEYWPTSRNKAAMAKVFGVSEGTARRWYREAIDRDIEERR